MVYLIAVTVAFIAAFLNDRMTPALRKSVLITLCVYIVLILGFRYKVGVDTISYMNSYRHIPPIEHFFSANTFERTRFEPGYLFICSLCKTFTNEFWPVQIIMAAITNGCVFIFLNRYCRNVFIGILFYFLFLWLYYSTEIMRESAAIGIFLLNYKNLEEKKWLKYYLFTIPSLLFHYSAIFIWFIPLARFLKPNWFFYVSCIIFIGITPLVERLNELLQIAAITGRIEQYTNGAQDLNLNWRLSELIKSALPAIATLIAYHMAKLKSQFRYLILLQVILCIGAFAVPLIFSRFANYTKIFIVVAAANVILVPTLRHWAKLLFISIMILSQAHYYYTFRAIWWPYESIFYPQTSVERNKIYQDQFLQWLRMKRSNRPIKHKP